MDTVCPTVRLLASVTPSKFVEAVMVSTSGLVTKVMNGGKFESVKVCPETACIVPVVRVNRRTTRSEVIA